MARYKRVDMSSRLLPVDLDAQLVPGTFAHALHHLIDELGLSAFDARYRNDDNGTPAHDPAMLLRAVLLGYSRGLVNSRAIERACRDNVLFVAITGDAKPHFTTIAASDRKGPTGGLRKSNLTDNESAKLAPTRACSRATADSRWSMRPNR
jgi:transposase